MSDFAQSVKQQVDIVKVIEGYIRLRKAGAQNYSGLCPFHKEKSPSFSVHAVRQFYHCFGCGVSGDVFSFVQKIENSSFPEAVRTVATKLGIPLPKQNLSAGEAKEASLRGKLLDLHESATFFFEQQLRTPAAASSPPVPTKISKAPSTSTRQRRPSTPRDAFSTTLNAKEAIRKLDYSIVVEGYLDTISVFTAGMHNVIASSGTAFGEAQVQLL